MDNKIGRCAKDSNNNKQNIRTLRKALCVFLCVALLMGMLSGCTEKKNGKTVVTILYSNDFKHLENLVEKTDDDIDLQYERISYSSEYIRRLEKGAGPDLVIMPQASSEIGEKYLLDIGDTQASTAYDGTMMQQLQMDGTTYLLPLPGQYSGYIINKTLFEKAGLSFPSSNKELLESLTKLKKQGIGVGEDGINFSINSDYNTDLGMFFTGYMVPDFLGTVKGVSWLADFQRKQATFAGTWEKMFNLTGQMIEAGLLDAASIGKQRNSIRTQERMAEGTLAAAFGSTSLYQNCVEKNKADAEAGTSPEYSYQMLPLLSDQGNEPWLILSPLAYVGINAAADEKTQDAAKRILELLSTPEGQDAAMEDLQMGVSYLRDYKPNTSFIPKELNQYIDSGYIYNVQFPDRILEYLGSQARKVVAGTLTAQEALKSVDQYYYEGLESVDYDLSVVGRVKKDMLLQNYNVRQQETELGNLLADSVAQASGAPIAAVNSGGIRSSLYAGEVYGEDLAAVCPFDNVIIVLEMKGQTLWDMVENSLSTVSEEIPGGRFLQVSGITYTFDSSKPAGQRLTEIKSADGSALDKEKTYQVAVNNYMAGSQGYAEGNGDGLTMLNYYDDQTPKGNVRIIRETEMTYRDALAHYFNRHQKDPIDVKLEDRIIDLSKKTQK